MPVRWHFLISLCCFLLSNSALSSPVSTTEIVPSPEQQRLIYVQAVWRHGDRAPHRLPYPNDRNNESAWPRGWSQLTNTGIKQLYELGRYFRKRYNNYIGEFDPNDVRVMTSESDRAIVSAQAMLYGLFPVENANVQWLDGENWQPIPFHIESIERNAPVRTFIILVLIFYCNGRR
ncbi:unnamed protein product [Gongylonema pulchrum]|uniref:Histidine acid phosphatase n=1 Tax=Gongylonema pulchrum TaxID=637853 RepID=A0A183D0W0_9BILA|nr:unnamed protein product [Gongylonema pulchrum]